MKIKSLFAIALAVSVVACSTKAPQAPEEGRVWVPGHYSRYNVWVPGHYMPRANPVGYRPGSVWIMGHYNRFGGWVPGHWQ